MVLLGIFICFWMLVTFHSYWIRSKQNAEYEHLRSQIQTHVPLGSSEAKVKLFLDTEGIENSLLGQRGEERIVAIKRKTTVDIIFTNDIRCVFVFDASKKLTSYTMKNISTGP